MRDCTDNIRVVGGRDEKAIVVVVELHGTNLMASNLSLITAIKTDYPWYADVSTHPAYRVTATPTDDIAERA